MRLTLTVRASALLASLFLIACVPPQVSGLDASIDLGDAGGATDAGSTTDAGTSTDAGVVTVLRVRYPAGTRAVFARGSKAPLDWNTGIPMVKVNDDTWTLSVPTLAEAFEWKPLLDDTLWSKGPNYNGRLREVNEITPHFFIENGQWSIRWPTFTSALLSNTRGIYVYLPPTYLENAAARMPVVYMHDGQNLFDPNAAFGRVTWRVPETMDSAAGDGRFREAIIIGAENAGGARISEYTPTADPNYGGGNGDLYLRMMVEELKPRVDAELRTRPGREDTVLIGSSLGGLISSHAGARKPEVFGFIGAMSPSVWWDNKVLLTTVGQTGSIRPLRVYVDSGDSGPSNDGVDDTRALAAAYRTLGYVDGSNLRHVVQQGATHTESAWASRLPGALEFLLGPGR